LQWHHGQRLQRQLRRRHGWLLGAP
jgi:hypothetical protein